MGRDFINILGPLVPEHLRAALNKEVEEPNIISARGSTFTDPRDGQIYRTVKMGRLVWMAENLNYKIENSWCYDNNESKGKKYGRLYTWDAAKAASPAGWRLPSKKEWDNLLVATGGISETKTYDISRVIIGARYDDDTGTMLKSKTGWKKRGLFKSGNGTDEFGFSALPGGYRYSSGEFKHIRESGGWWSATETGDIFAYNRKMYHDLDTVREEYNCKTHWYSVRCVQDA